MIRQQFAEFFGTPPEVVSWAPGRLEFIGNHTDYNGGEVLGASLNLGVTVALSRREDKKLVFRSGLFSKSVEASIATIKALEGDDAWINYGLGVVEVMRSRGMEVQDGFNCLVDSNLPSGAGLSSSAAFELAMAYALADVYRFPTEKSEMARIAREAENRFVGVPCGILDQGVSAFGEKDKLVHIDCKNEIFSLVPLPKGVHLWVFNTAKKHSLVDSFYATRFSECENALKVLRISYPSATCLTDLEPKQVDEMDPTFADPLRKRALHVTAENERVKQTVTALQAQKIDEVGKLLTESHRSSQHLFENSCPELDLLVDLLVGSDEVHGARLTGGGFGGAVFAMTTSAFSRENAGQIQEEYSDTFGNKPEVIHAVTGAGAGVL